MNVEQMIKEVVITSELSTFSTYNQFLDFYASKWRGEESKAHLQAANQSYAAFQVKLKEILINCFQNVSPYARLQGDKCVVLPDKCKFYFRTPATCTFVIQEEPTIRTINFDGSWVVCEEIQKYSYSVALPYIIYMFVFSYLGKNREGEELWSFHQLHLACSQKSLMTMEDPIYYVPLPNLKGTKVCMGRYYEAPAGPVAKQVHEMISYYWNSRFHYDEWTKNIHFTSSVNKKFWTPEMWEKNSLEDAQFPLMTPLYAPEKFSLRTMIAEVDIPIIFGSDDNLRFVDICAVEWDKVAATFAPNSVELEKRYRNCVQDFINSSYAPYMNELIAKANRIIANYKAAIVNIMSQNCCSETEAIQKYNSVFTSQPYSILEKYPLGTVVQNKNYGFGTLRISSDGVKYVKYVNETVHLTCSGPFRIV